MSTHTQPDDVTVSGAVQKAVSLVSRAWHALRDSKALPVARRPSMVSTGSQTTLERTPCVHRQTNDQAKDQFDDVEEFDFEDWFSKHADADGTVSQHQIDIALLEQEHESDRWLLNNSIYNLEKRRRVYADRMGDIKTVCGGGGRSVFVYPLSSI